MSLLATFHPTIWRLIEDLKKGQSLTEVKIYQFIAKQETPQKIKKIEMLKDITENIMSTYYDELHLDEYLFNIGIAHNL